MTRVLWVTRSLVPGGVERLLVMTAAHLPADEFDVTCAYVRTTDRDLVGELEQAGVRCVPVTGRAWPLRLARLVRRGRFHLVHAHSPAPAAITRLTTRLMRRSARPVHITTEHSPRQHYRPVTRLLTSVTSALDDMVIAVSEAVAVSVRGRAAARCHVQYQGIDLAPFTAAAAERAQHADTTLRILAVANFRPAKAHDVLLHACRELADARTSFELSLVGCSASSGEAAYEQAIRRLVDELDLGDRVRFLGSRPDIPALMAEHDVLAISSDYEAGPLVAIEAATAHLPIVSTDVGLLHEVFEADVDHLRVPVGDHHAFAAALQRCQDDPQLRQALADSAARLAQRFDIGDVTDSLMRIYRAAAGTTPPRVVTVASGAGAR